MERGGIGKLAYVMGKAGIDRREGSCKAVGWERGEAHLVCYYGPGRRSCVGRYDDAAIEYAAHDRRAGAGGFWKRNALGVEGGVAVVVCEVEAAHADGWWRRWTGGVGFCVLYFCKSVFRGGGEEY